MHGEAAVAGVVHRVVAVPGPSAEPGALVVVERLLDLLAGVHDERPVLGDRLGYRHASSVAEGIVDLLWQGEWFVGLVVLLFSIVFPLVKIVMLLELSLLGLLQRRHKALTYRVMEYAGKWSMMDVMLLAFLVMLVKLGDLVAFHFGPAVLAFVLCVAMSMIASMSFDPHAIWEEQR